MLFVLQWEASDADGLLQHADIEVKVSVASCICQIMRVTAPDGPYGESRLKLNTTHTAFFAQIEYFELAVLAFGKLSCLDGRCYSKAISIIEVLAKYQTCVLMWDLELDALIVQMFQHFLNSLREIVIKFGNGASKAQVENAAKKELDSEATHASRKRAWKPNFLNKPDEGYDHAWSSGGRRSKAHNLLKGRGKHTKIEK